MSEKSGKILEDVKVSVKMKLSAFWITIMFLYVYADILWLYKPGTIGEIMAGKIGPFEVSQATLLAASIVVIIPAIMVFLSLALKPKVNRWTNIIVGALFTLVNISNLLGENWVFYILFGIFEIVLTVLIVRTAWKWPAANQAT